jgi:hypothetical protein
MTTDRRRPRQLELPMLSDVNGKSQMVQNLASERASEVVSPSAARGMGATPQDMAVYNAIAQDYFSRIQRGR